MTKLSAVKDAHWRSRLSVVTRAEISNRRNFESDETLNAKGYIVNVQEVGMTQVPYSELIARENFLLGMRITVDTSYEIFNPKTMPFVTTQETVRIDAIRHYVEHPDRIFGFGYDSEPRLYEMEDGTLVLLDGNHRMAAAILTGRAIEVAIRRRASALAA